MYNNAINQSTIDAALSLYSSGKSEYKAQKAKNKIRLYWTLPTLAVTYALSILYWKKIKKAGPKPKFSEQSPFNQAQLYLLPNTDGIDYPMLQFSFKF